MTLKKTYIASFLLVLATIVANAEDWKWVNPLDSPYPVVQNQAWIAETGRSYHRLPDRAQPNVRGAVWNLGRHSAGLAVHFYSNAPKIRVRYTVSGPLAMHHMPATGVSGVDLYGIDSEGKSRRFFGFFNGYPDADTLTTAFVNDRMNESHGQGYEFRLYLPLYNSAEFIEIGVPDSCDIRFLPASQEKPIVLYGSSIEQGAVASRPGMAWGTQIQRSLDMPLVNLGFSGNGRLEKGILDLMAEVDASLYILSCLPNLTGESPETLDSLTCAAIANLRSANNAPIILLEHSGFSDVPVNAAQAEIIERLNTASKAIYKKLLAQGVKDIYYVSREDMAIPCDGWTDDVHPSDMGQTAIAKAVEKVVRRALHIPEGNSETTRPVTQRREPGSYEWRERHEAILAKNKINPPKKVLIGNSITHYWGGEPEAKLKSGPKSWNKYMQPAGFGNFGFGWDRIENALWRVYHGELDGFEAEEIYLMIGTNNFGRNTNAEIIDGLGTLLDAVRIRQPKARIFFVGILPRRDGEEWSRSINADIEKFAAKEGVGFINPGLKLLNADGSLNEKLFRDGLHPNEKGYGIIAPIIADKH